MVFLMHVTMQGPGRARGARAGEIISLSRYAWDPSSDEFPSPGRLPPPRHAARATPPRGGSHHPVTLRVPPLLGEAPTTPSRCACHPSSGRLPPPRHAARATPPPGGGEDWFLPASHEAGWRAQRAGAVWCGLVFNSWTAGQEGHGGHGEDRDRGLHGHASISSAERSAFLERPLFCRVLRVLPALRSGRYAAACGKLLRTS